METFDKVATYLCQPFEKHVFTPLYRLLARKPNHQISDQQRNLMRFSQSTLLLGIPIMLLSPFTMYLNYRFYSESKKLIGNTDKYRRAAMKSVVGLTIMTSAYFCLLVAYPTDQELRVKEIRKKELEEFTEAEEFKDIFKPQHPVKSIESIGEKEGKKESEVVVKKIDTSDIKIEKYQEK